MAAISVDVGTSLIKAVAYDHKGRELFAAHHTTQVLRPQPGHSEQDMGAVWEAVASTIRELSDKLREPIEFLALTAQGDGCWLVDEDGNPTGPAILWNDGRAREVVRRWEQCDVIAQAFLINGSRHFSGLPHAILSWLAENDADRLASSHKSLYCGGWIFSKLTGELAVDESDASAPFLDIRRRTYSEELLALYEMEWAERLLPPVLSNQDRVRPLSRTAAETLGLERGLPVVLSSYDVASTALGAGIVTPGQACSVLGTTLCTEVLRDSVDTGGPASGLCLVYNVSGTYLRAFPTLAGTEVFGWMQGLTGVDHPGDFGRMSAALKPGAQGIFFLPYLSPAGERNPFFHSGASGSFFGLSFEHGPAHLAKAVLEGLAFVIRECLDAANARPHELRVCGGAAKDDVWCQMIADVTELPVVCSDDSEVGARGAFIQGTVSTGLHHSLAEAAGQYVKMRRTFHPDSHRIQEYSDLYMKFLTVRNAVMPLW